MQQDAVCEIKAGVAREALLLWSNPSATNRLELLAIVLQVAYLQGWQLYYLLDTFGSILLECSLD
jgi:hypothetical protein